MTYCAGWKYKNSVFLLADTAATKGVAPATSHSSFGQLQTQVRGDYVEECLCKLVPIGNANVVAYAGDVRLAAACIDFMRSAPLSMSTVEATLQAMVNSLGPFAKDAPVELLIASSNSQGESKLVHWDTQRGLNPAGSDFYQIGSLTSYHAALTPSLLSILGARNLASDRMLAVSSAIVQSYGVHDNLIDLNVGGLIFGIETRRGDISWQRDTNYVLYDPAFTLQGIVTALERDNALVVSSSITDDVRVMAHSASTSVSLPLTSEWVARVKSELDSGMTPLWVFLCTAGRAITLVFRTDVHAESRYVKLTQLGRGKFDLALSSELMGLLQQPLVDRNDGSLPFRLNVRND